MIRLWALLLVCTTVVQGVHYCVRTDNYRCQPGNNDFDVRYWGLGDGDLDDLSLCLDQVGRSLIETISLDDTDFVDIPEDFLGGLTSLVSIRLNHLPNLTTLPDGLFAGLGSLVKISMRDNALETLPEGLFSGLSVETKYMDHNPIVQLPGKLYEGLTSLENLYFYENNVDISIPNHIFGDNVNLETLFLNDNNCGFLHRELFSRMSKLEVMRLDDNELTFLSDIILDDLEQLTELDLSGNPELDCIPPRLLLTCLQLDSETRTTRTRGTHFYLSFAEGYL